MLLQLSAHVNVKGIKGLADFLGENRNKLYGWISKASIGDTGIILAKIPEIRLDWLRTGDPPMLHEDIGLKEPSSRIAKLYQIPVLGKVPAGIPNTLEEYIEEYISVPNAPPGAYALKVFGESMEPGIKHGDYVLFVIDRDPRSGDVVVVNDEFGDSMIKRYKVKGDEQRLVSDNPVYPTYIPNSHYRIMGVVVGGWRELKI